MLIYIVLFLDAKSKLCCNGYLTLQRSVTGHHPCCETMHDLFPLSTTSSSRAFGMHNIRSWRWTCRSSPRLFRKTQHVRPPSNFFLLLSLSRCCSCYTPKPDIYISTMSALLNRIKRRPSHEYGAISHEHSEQHFESAEIVRDTIIGLSGRLLLGRGGGRARVCFADFHLAHRWIDCTIRVGRWFVVLGWLQDRCVRWRCR